ncbi:MAG: hypothetical protein Q8O00_05830 [Holophaga sp.]|nr:hypothetical protein [Holophaga sp.]
MVAAGLNDVDAVYLTGGSSALLTLIETLRRAMPQATLVEGNRFGGVAAGLAWAGALQQFFPATVQYAMVSLCKTVFDPQPSRYYPSF